MANPPSSSEFDWKMYRYVPSLALGILFVILFSIMAAMHTFAYCRHRKANTIYMILGALCTYPYCLLYMVYKKPS